MKKIIVIGSKEVNTTEYRPGLMDSELITLSNIIQANEIDRKKDVNREIKWDTEKINSQNGWKSNNKYKRKKQ